MFTISCKVLQTSLIIKELIKHENKFNRKAFNYENRFSEFPDFMKVFKKYIITFIGSSHNETIVKYLFHEIF